MSAARQPMDLDFPASDSWHSLVQEKGYRLCAAGGGRAVIVEGLTLAPSRAPQALASSAASGFDAQYGLRSEASGEVRRYLMLTEVSRASDGARANGGGAPALRARNASPWAAVRSIHPLSEFSSFVTRRAANLVCFLVRSALPHHAPAQARTPTLDVSAVQIGRSLGLSQPDLEALRVAGLVCELGKSGLAENLPVAVIFPKDDGYEIGAVSIIKGAPHLSAAQKFVDFILTPTPMEINARNGLRYPVRGGVKMPEGVPPFETLQFVNYDQAKVNANLHAWLERWTQITGK